jgi:hypothetical protein
MPAETRGQAEDTTQEEELPPSGQASAVPVAVTETEVAGQGRQMENVTRGTSPFEDKVRGALDGLREPDLIREVPGDRPDLGPRFVVKSGD